MCLWLSMRWGGVTEREVLPSCVVFFIITTRETESCGEKRRTENVNKTTTRLVISSTTISRHWNYVTINTYNMHVYSVFRVNATGNEECGMCFCTINFNRSFTLQPFCFFINYSSDGGEFRAETKRIQICRQTIVAHGSNIF